VFPSGLCSTSQFVAKLSSSMMYSQHVPERELLERKRIVCCRWWELSPLPPRYSHAHVICFIDSPEVGPGRILSPSGPSASASGPTSAFGDPFSITTTPAYTGRHSSNVGPIIGGVIGGIAVISILVAALFFYRRRRRSLVSSPVFEGDIDPHMDQVSRSASSQGTVSSYSPVTPTSLLRPYVHIFIFSSSSACVCSHNAHFFS
jgi:hypothetical protein